VARTTHATTHGTSSLLLLARTATTNTSHLSEPNPPSPAAIPSSPPPPPPSSLHRAPSSCLSPGIVRIPHARLFLPASDHSAAPPRPFFATLSVSPLDHRLTERDAAACILRLSSSPHTTAATSTEPQAVVLLLHYSLVLHARPRPTAPAPQPLASPRCLLPSSQKNGIWRRQRPGFAFSQVSTAPVTLSATMPHVRAPLSLPFAPTSATLDVSGIHFSSASQMSHT